MTIIFRKLTDAGFTKTEYEVNEVKYTDSLIAIDIIGIGWRALEKKDFDSFVILK